MISSAKGMNAWMEASDDVYDDAFYAYPLMMKRRMTRKTGFFVDAFSFFGPLMMIFSFFSLETLNGLSFQGVSHSTSSIQVLKVGLEGLQRTA